MLYRTLRKGPRVGASGDRVISFFVGSISYVCKGQESVKTQDWRAW